MSHPPSVASSTPLSPSEALRLFNTHAFLLLSSLPPRTQLTLDAHPHAYLTAPTFQGIKLIPPGWHCIAWNVPAATTASDTVTPHDTAPLDGVHGIRNVLLRYFQGREVVVRSFDRATEQLLPPRTASEPADPTTSDPSLPSSSSTNFPPSASAPKLPPRRTGRQRRRRRLSHSDRTATSTPDTAVSPEYLQTLDAHLLPFPLDGVAGWTRATGWLNADAGRVGRRVVARVVGFQPGRDDAVVDSMVSGPDGTASEDTADGRSMLSSDGRGGADGGGRREGGKVVWGKSRPAGEEVEEVERFEVLSDGESGDDGGEGRSSRRKRKRNGTGPSSIAAPASVGTAAGREGSLGQEANDDDEDEHDDASLRYTHFDLRRSWPPGATGSTLTRWSLDKSWLLASVLDRSASAPASSSSSSSSSRMPKHADLLAEYELAFLLFVTSHNAHSYQHWHDLTALFCGCAAFLGANGRYELHPSLVDYRAPHPMRAAADEPPLPRDLAPHTAFLTTLAAQLDLLPASFWHDQQTPKQETELLQHLHTLRAAIARALAAAAAQQHVHPDGNGNGNEAERQTETPDGADGLVAAWRRLSHLARQRFGWELDGKLDEEREVDEEIADELDEDGPVVVLEV